MKTFIFIVGLIILLFGAAILIKPLFTKKLFHFIAKGKRIYLVGILRIILGVLFLIGALSCDYYGIIIFFGILFCVSGLTIFIMKFERLKAIMNWFDQKPVSFMRLMAILAMLIGAIITYAA
jgi:hypothetical protein